MLQRLKKQKTKKRGAVVFRPGGWEDVQRGKPSYVFSVQIFNLIPSIVLPSTVYGCHGTFRRRSPLYACAVRKKKKALIAGNPLVQLQLCESLTTADKKFIRPYRLYTARQTTPENRVRNGLKSYSVQMRRSRR